MVFGKRKRRFCGLAGRVFWLSLICLLASAVWAVALPAVPAPEVGVMLDGQALNFDVQPRLQNGRTLVPLRGIFEAFNAAVVWDDKTGTITVTGAGKTIVMQPGQLTVLVNGQTETIDVPASIENGRTLVPLRFLIQHLGADITWDGVTRQVRIQRRPAALPAVLPEVPVSPGPAVPETPAETGSGQTGGNAGSNPSAGDSGALAAATAATAKAEDSMAGDDVNNAATLVNALPAGTGKTALLARVAAVQSIIDATEAVKKAEGSRLQLDVDDARLSVNALPAGAVRTALLGRLGAILVAAPMKISLAADATQVEVGEKFSVAVEASGIDGLYAFQLSLTYDPALVEIAVIGDKVKRLDIGGSVLGSKDVFPLVDSQPGALSYGLTKLGKVAGFSGDGNLVKVGFVAKAAGKISIEIGSESVKLIGADRSQPTFDLRVSQCQVMAE